MGKLIEHGAVEQRIFLIRDKRVMVDRDLAEIYGVETKYLNRQVKRNIKRFPEEFMFQLNANERSELVTNWHRFESMKHSSVLPHVFTEHGVAMLATVLNSDRAVRISIYIIKVFVKLREMITNHKELADKLKELEKRVDGQGNEIQVIIRAIKELIERKQGEKPKRKIGFHGD